MEVKRPEQFGKTQKRGPQARLEVEPLGFFIHPAEKCQKIG